MSSYGRWAASSQGAWVISMLFFLVAALNAATADWPLAALLAAVGALNLGRAFNRLKRERARS